MQQTAMPAWTSDPATPPDFSSIESASQHLDGERDGRVGSCEADHQHPPVLRQRRGGSVEGDSRQNTRWGDASPEKKASWRGSIVNNAQEEEAGFLVRAAQPWVLNGQKAAAARVRPAATQQTPEQAKTPGVSSVKQEPAPDTAVGISIKPASDALEGQEPAEAPTLAAEAEAGIGEPLKAGTAAVEEPDSDWETALVGGKAPWRSASDAAAAAAKASSAKPASTERRRRSEHSRGSQDGHRRDEAQRRRSADRHRDEPYRERSAERRAREDRRRSSPGWRRDDSRRRRSRERSPHRSNGRRDRDGADRRDGGRGKDGSRDRRDRSRSRLHSGVNDRAADRAARSTPSGPGLDGTAMEASAAAGLPVPVDAVQSATISYLMGLAEPEERATMLMSAAANLKQAQRTLQYQRLPHAGAAAGHHDGEEHSEPPPLPDSLPPSQVPSGRQQGLGFGSPMTGQEAASAKPTGVTVAAAVEAAPATVPQLTGDEGWVQPPLPPLDAAASDGALSDPFDAAANRSGFTGTSQQMGHVEERKGTGRRRRWGPVDLAASVEEHNARPAKRSRFGERGEDAGATQTAEEAVLPWEQMQHSKAYRRALPLLERGLNPLQMKLGAPGPGSGCDWKRYKTQMCVSGDACPSKRVCAGAHCASELLTEGDNWVLYELACEWEQQGVPEEWRHPQAAEAADRSASATPPLPPSRLPSPPPLLPSQPPSLPASPDPSDASRSPSQSPSQSPPLPPPPGDAHTHWPASPGYPQDAAVRTSALSQTPYHHHQMRAYETHVLHRRASIRQSWSALVVPYSTQVSPQFPPESLVCMSRGCLTLIAHTCQA